MVTDMKFEVPERENHDTLMVEFLVRGEDILPLTTRPFAVDGEEVYHFTPTRGEVFFNDGSLEYVGLAGTLHERPGREGSRVWRAVDIPNAPERIQDSLALLIGTNRLIHDYLNRERG